MVFLWKCFKYVVYVFTKEITVVIILNQQELAFYHIFIIFSLFIYIYSVFIVCPQSDPKILLHLIFLLKHQNFSLSTKSH